MSIDTSKYIFNPEHCKLIWLVLTVNFPDKINEILRSILLKFVLWFVNLGICGQKRRECNFDVELKKKLLG